jgi:hypothetical protein
MTVTARMATIGVPGRTSYAPTVGARGRVQAVSSKEAMANRILMTWFPEHASIPLEVEDQDQGEDSF